MLKIKFDDGYEGVVDLRPLIAKGKVFAWLSAPERFAALKVDEFGHSVAGRRGLHDRFERQFAPP